jgi:hypothetical protein
MHVVCSGFVRHFVLFQDHMTNVTIKVVPLESTAAQTLGTTTMEEPSRFVSTDVEFDGRPAELECDHFSIR